MVVSRQELGTLGEQAASRLLERGGYRIVARNYRVRQGEIDIVCSRGDLLVFCEVKTRASTAFGLPEEAVTVTKQQRLRRLAAEYLRREGRWAGSLRFDVVSVNVSGGKIVSLRHIENAF